MSNRSRTIILSAVAVVVIGAAGFALLRTSAPPDKSPKSSVTRPLDDSIKLPTATPVDNSPKSPASPEPKTFELNIVDGQVKNIGDTIKVSQGDQVELRWSSDRQLSLHLHGYDVERKVSPDAPAVMAFKANLAGRFSVSEHGHGAGHERAILYLEVHP